jgi:hypothetical protein
MQRLGNLRCPFRLSARLGAVAVALLLLSFLGYLRWPYGQAAVETALGQKFFSRVEIRSFRTVYFPRPGYIAEDVRLYRIGDGPMPPLASIAKLTSYGSYLGLFTVPAEIQSLRAEGLVVRVPRGIRPSPTQPPPTHWWSSYKIDEVIADGSELQILPRAPGKQPLRFVIDRLRLRPLATGRPIDYQATFQNPLPRGTVQTHGRLGPIDADHLGQTPVSGAYRLRNAQLSSLKNLSGALNSQATFQGKLEDLRVQGTAASPNFQLLSARHPVPLDSRFLLNVDGMTGDVRLDSVVSHFNHTTMWSTGYVKSEPGLPGKTTTLEMTVQEGRIEDLLYPLTRANPPAMQGTVHFLARGTFPAGGGPFLRRISIAGAFDIEQSTLTRAKTQQKIARLSERTRKSKTRAPQQTMATLHGRVALQSGIGDFSSLVFHVPGATAQLHGTYNLLNEKVDFSGKLATDGTLSQDASGIQSILLWPLNPLFKRHGKGAVLPIRITGTYSRPRYRVSF